MAAVTHILYDLGNTLIFFDGHWPEVFQRAANALGEAAHRLALDVDPARLAEAFRSRMERYYEQREHTFVEGTTETLLQEVLAGLGISQLPGPAAGALLRAFYTVTQAHWQPDPAARQTLETLQTRGYAQGILSNAAYDLDVQQLVDAAALRPLVDFVLSSAAIGFRKPHPAAFQAALSRWDVPAEKVLMVGDTLNADILGAARSGLHSAWVHEHVQVDPSAPDAQIRPDFTLGRITELVDLLD